MTLTATPDVVARAQRNYDRQEPRCAADFFSDDELDFREPVPRNGSRYAVTDEQVEKFILDLTTTKNLDIFLENTLGAFPRASQNELALHIACARQWVKNKEAVGELIGPAFFQWAKEATLAAISLGWTAEDIKARALAHYTEQARLAREGGAA